MIVIDPFTNPTVITGSHSFSASASIKNDENLLIVQGNRALAERYAVNIMATYQHYRWRAYLQRVCRLAQNAVARVEKGRHVAEKVCSP